MTHPYIPYFKTSRYRVETMVELANISPSDCVADLGSGDGRISIACAEKGATVVGFELDPVLADLSEKEIKDRHLETFISVQRKNFWDEDLSGFNVICVYPMPDIMEDLEVKLMKELKSGAKVLLNYYPFPTLKPAIQKNHIFLYIF